MTLHGERIAELEVALEQLVEGFELVDAPPEQLEGDLLAAYRQLQHRVAYAARVVRGTCHCRRFELRECQCPKREVQ